MAIEEKGNTKFSICYSGAICMKFVMVAVELFNFECAEFDNDNL